jgi:large subunit ribosomal protein L1
VKKPSKRFRAAAAKVDAGRLYPLDEAVAVMQAGGAAKFNEAVDIAVNLGVDTKHAEQVVRGTVSLPHGTGKTVRVLVINKGNKDGEAREAGADHVGFDEFIKKIEGGWTDFDVLIATPDVMGQVGKLGKILGPRGLMPSPKSGTVTMNIGQAVREVKGGKIEFRTDKNGILHASVGKRAFEARHLAENILSFMSAVQRLKPAAAKGTYIKKVAISTTMGPGVHLDPLDLQARTKEAHG